MAKCTDSFNQAFSHTKRLLFQPFQLVFWLKLVFLLYAVYALSSLFQLTTNLLLLADINFQEIIWVQVVPVLLGMFLLVILFQLCSLFLSAVTRILFYDAVWSGVSQYLESFSQYFSQILSYILWNIAFAIVLFLVAALGFVILAGIAWFIGMTSAGMQIFLLVGGFILALVLLGILILYFTTLDALVLPQMITKKMGIFAAWSVASEIIRQSVGEFLGFTALRIAVKLAYGVVLFGVLFTVYIVISALSGAGMEPKAMFVEQLITTVLTQPLIGVLLFLLLPLSVFMDCYSLCFCATMQQDPQLLPQTGEPALQPLVKLDESLEPDMPAETTVDPSPLGSTPGGPIRFRDIPIDDSPSQSRPDDPLP
ncbi:MAG: hypothetical protein RBU29_11955 [bacterium]|jgi:hypothetical protein|nr:hypothetical protein [bacterium]